SRGCTDERRHPRQPRHRGGGDTHGGPGGLPGHARTATGRAPRRRRRTHPRRPDRPHRRAGSLGGGQRHRPVRPGRPRRRGRSRRRRPDQRGPHRGGDPPGGRRLPGTAVGGLPMTFTKAYWDEHYDSRAPGAAHPPNPYLVAAAQHLPPGRALDAGCGEGAETIWLATRGWQVTAVDIAATALHRARRRAETSGLTDGIDWIQADLTEWTP